jgi:hypothetical protein
MIFYNEKVRTVISNNGSYYKKLGYKDCKQGTELYVPVKHLKSNSNLKVKYECDHCKKINYRQFQLLTKVNIHLCYDCSRKNVGETMDRTNIDLATKNRNGINHPRWNPNKSEFKSYANKVRWLTEKTYKLFENVINPSKLPRTLCGIDGGYQLDHIKSIKFGFQNGITPEELSSVNNLQMLPWQINRKKHHNIEEN